MDHLASAASIGILNKACALQDNNLIYGFLPGISGEHGAGTAAYAHSLNNIPSMVDAAQAVFAGAKRDIIKSSPAFLTIVKEKERLFSLLGESGKALGFKAGKISAEKAEGGLAIAGSIYFRSFFLPTQFFLPDSSLCSGHWKFWENIDYQSLLENFQRKDSQLKLCRLLLQKKFTTAFQSKDFPEIVSKRLQKENLYGKPLDPLGLLKAVIIRMGELASPSVPYEVVDFSIRRFFSYLEIKHYIRVDREVLFLRELEKGMYSVLKEIL